MSKGGQTPSQTVGPYFAYGLVAEQYGYPFTQVAGHRLGGDGLRIAIEGQVIDGAGQPVPDALLELWQPGQGFLRQGTGTSPGMTFRFETAKPLPAAGQAPHIAVALYMRGLLSHVFTRIYFADEPVANAADPVLAQVPADRRGTLLAQRVGEGIYRFDIRMQGERETVFLDI